MNSRLAGKYLLFSVLCFLMIKLYWVIAPASVMGVPRLGDDAYTYLWLAQSSVVSSKLESSAVQDILQFRHLNSDVAGEFDGKAGVEFNNARVAMRTTGVTGSPYSILSALFKKAIPEPKLAFAAMESFVAVALAICLALALALLYGKAAAASMIFLMSFALFPNQGIHYLIVSVLAMSLALVQWAVLFKFKRQFMLQLILTFLMLTIHPIGQVYVLGTLTALALKVILTRQLERSYLHVLIAIGIGALCAVIYTYLSGAQAPATTGMGGLSFENAPNNLAAIFGYVYTFAKGTPLLALLSLMGVWLAVKNSRRDESVLIWMLGMMLVGSALVDLPGYPGELGSRVLVPLAILTAASGVAWIFGTKAVQVKAVYRYGFFALLLISICLNIPKFNERFYKNINSRHQVIDSELLAKEIQHIRPESTIIWVDTDVAMMAGFLEGAYDINAIPLRMVVDTPLFGQALHKQHESDSLYIATTMPGNINGTSAIRSSTLEKRFNGYDLNLFRKLRIQNHDQTEIESIYLRIKNYEAEKLKVTRFHDGREFHCALKPVEQEWILVQGCEKSGDFVLNLTGKNTMQLLGFGETLVPDVNWPWAESNWELVAYKGKRSLGIRFGLVGLLGEGNLSVLRKHLNQIQLISDESGVVWLRAQKIKN